MDQRLLVENLAVQYGEKVAVKNISFTINSGEIVGCLGPNGAGKSSTIRAICGIVKPRNGRVITCSVDVAEAAYEVKRRVGYVAEDAAVIDVFTPLEYFRFLSDLRELPAAAFAQTGQELLAQLNLQPEALHLRMGGFSKGMKQKVAIAAALAHNPQLLLLDEPLNGLDVDSTSRFKSLLYQYAESGGAILYCSHLVDVMERFVQRVIIMQDGRVMADAPLAQILSEHGDGSLEQAFTAITQGAPLAQTAEAPEAPDAAEADHAE